MNDIKTFKEYVQEGLFKPDERMNQKDYTHKMIITGEDKTFELRFFEDRDVVVSIEDYRKLPLGLKGMNSKRGYNIFKNQKSFLTVMKKRSKDYTYEIKDI